MKNSDTGKYIIEIVQKRLGINLYELEYIDLNEIIESIIGEIGEKEDVEGWLDQHILINEKIEQLNHSTYFVKGCKVANIGGDAKVGLVCSQVESMKERAYAFFSINSTNIQSMYDGACIKVAEDSFVGKLFGSYIDLLVNSIVSIMSSEAVVLKMIGTSKIGIMDDKAYVEVMRDNSCIESMCCNTKVGEMFDKSIIIEMNDNSMVNAMGEKTLIVKSSGASIGYKITEEWMDDILLIRKEKHANTEKIMFAAHPKYVKDNFQKADFLIIELEIEVGNLNEEIPKHKIKAYPTRWNKELQTYENLIVDKQNIVLQYKGDIIKYLCEISKGYYR